MPGYEHKHTLGNGHHSRKHISVSCYAFIIESQPPGYFEVMFTCPKKSRYRSLYSLRTTTQQAALLGCDVDRDTFDALQSCTNQFELFQDNPLDCGCFLQSIDTTDAGGLLCT